MISNNTNDNNRNSICSERNVVNATTTDAIQQHHHQHQQQRPLSMVIKEKFKDNNNSGSNKNSKIITANNADNHQNGITIMDRNSNALAATNANNNNNYNNNNGNGNVERDAASDVTAVITRHDHKMANNGDRKSILSTSSSYAATTTAENSEDDHLNGNDTSAIETEDECDVDYDDDDDDDDVEEDEGIGEAQIGTDSIKSNGVDSHIDERPKVLSEKFDLINVKNVFHNAKRSESVDNNNEKSLNRRSRNGEVVQRVVSTLQCLALTKGRSPGGTQKLCNSEVRQQQLINGRNEDSFKNSYFFELFIPFFMRYICWC
jgi:hypothetical protein